MNAREEQLLQYYVEFAIAFAMGMFAIGAMLGAFVAGYYNMFEVQTAFLFTTFWFVIMVIARTWDTPLRTLFIKIGFINDEYSLQARYEKLYGDRDLWGEE